jgi:hypothetical protein
MMGRCQYLVELRSRDVFAAVLIGDDCAARQELVDHLRACSSCRREAVDEDPTLAFSLLEAEPVDAGRIAEIQKSVRTLRRSRAIERSDKPPLNERGRAFLVAASLLFVLTLLPLTNGRSPEESQEPKVGVVSNQQSRADWQQWNDDGTVTPVIEDLNRPEARVYQRTEEDLAVVMIVDETLDL